MNPVLQINDLRTYFQISDGTIKAVDGVNLAIRKGENLGLVGESGCGKTVLALSILKLVPDPPGRIVSGEIIFKNNDLISLNAEQMRHIRGNQISMIFQEPLSSLNPVYTIGEQIAEAIRLHQKANKKEAKGKSIELLNMVGIPDPAKRFGDYPHQMSGGMRQRVMIAMALSCQPDLLIADEPTTALDVTIQAQILELIESLRDELKMSIIIITHDLGVIAETAQRVAVMYAGHIVEESTVNELFYHPLHPYTIGLLKSLPRLSDKKGHSTRLLTIKGAVPDLLDIPPGCPFYPRCDLSRHRCSQEIPGLIELRPDHLVSCWEANP